MNDNSNNTSSIQNVINDTLVVDRFLEELAAYSDVLIQLGNDDRAELINRASIVIRLLTEHALTFGVGIPAGEILLATRKIK